MQRQKTRRVRDNAIERDKHGLISQVVVQNGGDTE